MNKQDKRLIIVDERQLLGKTFRIYGNADDPLFAAKDVAEWIDYTKTSQGYYNVSMMLRAVDDDEKLTINIVDSDGKPHKQWFLTEDGMTEVLMQSRKPIAKQFKKKVKEILRTIRKTGAYIAPEAKPLDNMGHMQAMMQQSQQMIDIMQKQTEMINCMGKLMAKSVDALCRLADGVSRLNGSAPAPVQLDLFSASAPALEQKKPVVPSDAMTLRAAAAKLGFYTIKSGKPNSSLVMDILRYGCGICIETKAGVDSEYYVVLETYNGESTVPHVWLKKKAVKALERYVGSSSMNTVVHRTVYKRNCPKHGYHAGDWRYDYVQYVGKKRHILGENDGSRKRYAA